MRISWKDKKTNEWVSQKMCKEMELVRKGIAIEEDEICWTLAEIVWRIRKYGRMATPPHEGCPYTNHSLRIAHATHCVEMVLVFDRHG